MGGGINRFLGKGATKPVPRGATKTGFKERTKTGSREKGATKKRFQDDSNKNWFHGEGFLRMGKLQGRNTFTKSYDIKILCLYNCHP